MWKRWYQCTIHHFQVFDWEWTLAFPPEPTWLRTKTAFLTPDSESAWKFTLKNLLHTSVYCCFRLKRLQCVKTLNFGFFEKWPVSTVSTVFKPKILKSDTGFEISVKIYPGIRTLYAFISLFSGGAATFTNLHNPKTSCLAFLTTCHGKTGGSYIETRAASTSTQYMT